MGQDVNELVVHVLVDLTDEEWEACEDNILAACLGELIQTLLETETED